MNSRYLFILLLFLLGIQTAFAQKVGLDGAKKKVQFKKVKAKKRMKPASSIFTAKKSKAPKAPNNLTKQKSQKNTQNFLLQTLPEDRDIVGKRYWKGKDVTHQKIKTDVEIGTIYTKSEKIIIEVRDDQYVDGDRIQLYFNNHPIHKGISLKGNFYRITLPLQKGYNRLDFTALNQGLNGPNTTEFKVYDLTGRLLAARRVNLLKGESATLSIIKTDHK